MESLGTKKLFVEPISYIPENREAELRFQKQKVIIHQELVDSLDLSMLAQISEKELSGEVRAVAMEICDDHASVLEGIDRERLLGELLSEVFGLGPLDQLMQDPEVSDILVNHAYEIHIEKAGQLQESDVIFADNQHLMRIIQRIVSRVGRRIDEVNPMVDARLPDGSRINAIIPPLALNGPSLSIRRFGTKPLQIDDLIEKKSVTPEIVDFLAAVVDSRISMLISGGTGSGKTTMLNALSNFIPREERLITIEDSAELLLQHKHVVRLETKVDNTEGVGEISQRQLVKNSLRMRPDRIIVGEVRGAEALDMLQAMNTGHEGSLTTVHANDTRDALARLEMMVAMSGFDLPLPVIRQYIANGIGIILHVSRLKGGQRCITKVSEIVSLNSQGDYKVEDIFGFEQTGIDDQGNAQGKFYATGYRPACLKRMESSGIKLSQQIFEKK
ncbi:CpaF family protein [Gimesia maris]|uniref:Conjugal transfer protein n=1 Tax=Gimesia maris TaxID=122 RepID=A0ABX5YLC2_9PLAN|nr:CpaF family protein [Gimesia maris]HAW26778.1 CpaF family protein [Planctomycetaceae bacterium]EDL56995.1 secretion system protein TadA [Gimesia maris DSM 8797]QDT78914.1 Putative conjugal transfer protein [Gimesia maris]QDU14445.1 Putative conjugal transfer protein [Gimesia maris]QEG16425.1 Putative conjugal transfer protein [Gimesia maris]|tara:strand:+ start:46909 stop:48243 length:1335 start_codon:yes stop_codon:yes gene_type:complete